MIKKILALCTVMLMSLAACAGSPVSRQVGDGHGNHRLTKLLENNVEVVVLIETVSYNGKIFPYAPPIWWGAEMAQPSSVIKRLSVAYNGKESWVRFSAYSDLADVNSVSLEDSSSGIHIVIDGGDTSTHYIAELFFDSEGFLSRRRVFSPSFPDEVWEETQYSFIRRANM